MAKTRKTITDRLYSFATRLEKIYNKARKVEHLEGSAYEELMLKYDKVQKSLYNFLLNYKVTEDEWYTNILIVMLYDGCSYEDILEEANLLKQKNE